MGRMGANGPGMPKSASATSRSVDSRYCEVVLSLPVPERPLGQDQVMPRPLIDRLGKALPHRVRRHPLVEPQFPRRPLDDPPGVPDRDRAIHALAALEQEFPLRRIAVRKPRVQVGLYGRPQRRVDGGRPRTDARWTEPLLRPSTAAGLG